MCVGQSTTFVFPNGRRETQQEYLLCRDSRDGRPCASVSFVDAGTRYVPGAQPSFSDPVSPVYQAPMGAQPEPIEVLLPSLTDGPTSSSVSTAKSPKPPPTERKYVADGSIFGFGFPFGKDKKKKRKDEDKAKDKAKEKEKEKSKIKSKAKAKKSDETTKADASRKPRNTPPPDPVLPEAPEPPPAATSFSREMPTQYATAYGPMSPGIVPSPQSPLGVFGPPRSQTQGPGPHAQRPTVYEERLPPNLRNSLPSAKSSNGSQESGFWSGVRPSPEPRTTPQPPPSNRQSVKFDLPPQRESTARYPSQPQPSTAQPTASSQPQDNDYLRRYEFRGAERERQRQAHQIADLTAQLQTLRQELADARAREAEWERNQEEQRQQRRRPVRPERPERPPSPTGATLGSSSHGHYQHQATPASYEVPRRAHSHRTPNHKSRAETRRAERATTDPYDQPAPNLPRRHGSLRTSHTHYSPPRYEPRETDTRARDSAIDIQRRISSLEADINAIRQLRHHVEEEHVTPVDADERRNIERLRQNAYDRLIGSERIPERERERERAPWDPGPPPAPPYPTYTSYRPVHVGEGGAARQRLRHSRHGSDNLHARFERMSTGLYSGPDVGADTRQQPSGRPWSWERERRRY